MAVSKCPKNDEISGCLAFFMRFGDVLPAGIVYAGTALGFAVWSFAALNLAFTGIWLARHGAGPRVQKAVAL